MATMKGVARQIAAAQRQAQRDAARRQRELEARQKQAQKLAELEQAALDVEAFDNYLDVITTLHADCGPEIDWSAIQSSPPPPAPAPVTSAAAAVHAELASSGDSRLFKKRAERKRAELASSLPAAEEADRAATAAANEAHQQALADHAETVTLAERVLSGDTDAYVDVFDSTSELSEVSGLGESVRFRPLTPNRVWAELNALSDDVVPSTMKTLLASGKLSEKNMPVGRRWELYQDHVCSAAIRVARDLLGLLPVEMVIVDVVDEILNPATGHKDLTPILSVAFVRSTLDQLNMNAIDPSDSLANFVHNMNFKKTKGFVPVERIDPAQFD